MAKPKTVKLWYFEFCSNNIGIWDRIWAASPTALEKERRALRQMNSRIDRRITPDDKLDGSCGNNSAPRSVEVELSAKGILDFANAHAIDDSL